MSEEVILEKITPRQHGVIMNRIKESGIFEMQRTGHIDIRKRSEIPNFPKCHGNFFCVGYVGRCLAMLTNTELRILRPYHEQLREVYESVRDLGLSIN